MSMIYSFFRIAEYGGWNKVSRIHVIWNPIAGNGGGARTFSLLDARIRELGISYSQAESLYAGHAVELAKQALIDGHELIIAVGGDGTVREVAGVLIGTDVPLGIIPSGTGNDLARPLGIPRDPLSALDVALSGIKRRMDAGTANGELFFNVAGFGFDVDVLDYTEIYKKKYKNGSLAYLRALLAAIKGLKLRKTRIETDEGAFEKNVLLLAVANGTHFGGGMCVAPTADPFDGALDVCVAHDVNKLTLLRLLPKFMKGKHLGLPYITYFRTKKLTAACEPVSRVETDGEAVSVTPVTFEIVPAAISVMVPRPGPTL